MKKSVKTQIKEAVWQDLTIGLDPECDNDGAIDDIKDNTGYAIDMTIKRTAQAIYDDVTKQLYPLVTGDNPKECPDGVLVKFVEIMDKWKRDTI